MRVVQSFYLCYDTVGEGSRSLRGPKLWVRVGECVSKGVRDDHYQFGVYDGNW